ncbi:MAG: glycosyltransferase family 4 protein [Caldiserica bacterium]|nr:glycosyltransferase family 4 protein [Caldisericota bacterium]
MAKEKIRVLRILHNLGGGGVQRRLLALIPYLQEDFSFHIISFKGGELEDKFRKISCEVKIIPRRGKFDPICIHQVRNYIAAHSFPIVHTHTHKPNTTGRISAILSRTPVIIAQEHNVDDWKGKFQRWIDVKLARFTNKIIAVSRAVKDFYVSLGIPEDKIIVIYNGLELEKFYPSFEAKKKNNWEGKPIVGFVGRIHPQKGIKDLLEIGKEVCKTIRGVKFLVVGEGPLKNWLTKEVEKRNLRNNFQILGKREDLPALYREMQILLLPSYREGFPNVILEAMASGVPVVATDAGGVNEIVENSQTGFVVAKGATQEMINHVLSLLKNRKIREEMGKRSREKVAFFSIERMAEETKNLYLSLIETCR